MLQNQEIDRLFNEMVQTQETDMVKARNHLVGDVDLSNSFSQSTYLEDDQRIGEATQVMTRNIVQPSVQLVCLTRKDGLTFLVDGDTPYNPDVTPHREIMVNILRSTVTVSKAAIVKYFWSQPHNMTWRKQPAIRQAYVVVFENGICQLENGTRLILDKDRGIVFQ